jgi:SWI/SNF-related matrix-associated actin-dependent regulator of chromatin subfamily A member 5
MTEFKRFCPEMKVIKLHSSDVKERERLKETLKKRNPDGSAAFDVVVTTYEMVKSPNMHATLGGRTHWRYLVLDEGHVIKNEASQISQSVRGLRFEHALLLTGTPLQNNLRELFALLNFLFPTVLPEKCAKRFDDAFDLTHGKVNDSDLKAAHKLLQPLMLRRLKAEVEGRLPPKLETTIHCPLTAMQRFWYQRLLLKVGPLSWVLGVVQFLLCLLSVGSEYVFFHAL